MYINTNIIIKKINIFELHFSNIKVINKLSKERKKNLPFLEVPKNLLFMKGGTKFNIVVKTKLLDKADSCKIV